MSCIFCDIVSGNIPAKFLYKDEQVVAFADIHPQAPIHIIIIPGQHITSVSDLAAADLPLVQRMVVAAQQLARDQGILERGYRLVINNGKEGGQVVPHLHMHLLGGRPLNDRLSG